jgi:ABC-type Fe3+ transport system permease subunit
MGQDFTFTPHHYTSVEAVPGFVSEYVGIEPIWTSLKIALVAAPLGGLLAVPIAYLAERVRGIVNEAMTRPWVLYGSAAARMIASVFPKKKLPSVWLKMHLR